MPSQALRSYEIASSPTLLDGMVSSSPDTLQLTCVGSVSALDSHSVTVRYIRRTRRASIVSSPS